MKTIVTTKFAVLQQQYGPDYDAIAKRLLSRKQEFHYSPDSPVLFRGDENSIDPDFNMPPQGGWSVHNHPSDMALPWPSPGDLVHANRFHLRRMDIVCPASGSVIIMKNKTGKWPWSIDHTGQMKAAGIDFKFTKVQTYIFTKAAFDEKAKTEMAERYSREMAKRDKDPQGYLFPDKLLNRQPRKKPAGKTPPSA
jgi:hypothetical protein